MEGSMFLPSEFVGNKLPLMTDESKLGNLH
jgi:hypothetical protein